MKTLTERLCILLCLILISSQISIAEESDSGDDAQANTHSIWSESIQKAKGISAESEEYGEQIDDQMREMDEDMEEDEYTE